MSTMILPCGVSNAAKAAFSGVTLSMSAVSSPLRNLRASSPATLTTPRSGNRAAFIVVPILIGRTWNVRRATRHLKGAAPGQIRIGRKTRLLARQQNGKLAIADAGGQPFGILRRRILAVGIDQLAQRAEQRGLRQAVPVDAV